jgi:hypothetical protein
MPRVGAGRTWLAERCFQLRGRRSVVGLGRGAMRWVCWIHSGMIWVGKSRSIWGRADRGGVGTSASYSGQGRWDLIGIGSIRG